MDQSNRNAVLQQRHRQRRANPQGNSSLSGTRKVIFGEPEVMNMERPTFLYCSPCEPATLNGIEASQINCHGN
jgi:hypothetical protein